MIDCFYQLRKILLMLIFVTLVKDQITFHDQIYNTFTQWLFISSIHVAGGDMNDFHHFYIQYN